MKRIYDPQAVEKWLRDCRYRTVLEKWEPELALLRYEKGLSLIHISEPTRP